MAYLSFDPRKTIREKICSSDFEFADGKELQFWYLDITDNYGDTAKIPMYLSDEIKSQELQEMPFIEMHLVEARHEPVDIGAAKRRKEGYIDIHIWYSDTDNIDRDEFGKKILNDLQNLIRTNQCDFDNIDFINANEVREHKEIKAHQIIYHYTLTVYCIYWDLTN